MPIDETINMSGESAESVPGAGTSTVSVKGALGSEGRVALIETSPNGQVISHPCPTGSRGMSTPEGNTYKFIVAKAVGNVSVFMGP